jgi:hypothetical protein
MRLRWLLILLCFIAASNSLALARTIFDLSAQSVNGPASGTVTNQHNYWGYFPSKSYG